MRIVVFSPYGKSRSDDEAAVTFLHLLAAFLRTKSPEITKIICDGCFYTCSRDLHRQERSCSICQSEQENLASWAQLKTVNLSKFIDSLLVAEANKILENASDSLTVDSIDIADSYKKFRSKNKISEEKEKQLLWSSIVSILATKKIITNLLPDLVLISSSDDFINNQVLKLFLQKGIKVFSVDQVEQEFNLQLKNFTLNKSIKIEIFSQEIEGIRSNTSKWPKEITETMSRCLEFLGLESNQLTLPLNRL